MQKADSSSKFPHRIQPRAALVKKSGVAATQQVYATLLAQILNFELKPFEELSEGRLAEQLGVSRTPVREALARLGKLQLVDIFPQRGTVIAPLRIRDLVRSQFMRESLELGLLRRAIQSPNRQRLVAVLGDEIMLQTTLASIGDERRFYASDELFHRQIAICAGLSDIWEAISDVKLHMDRFRHLMLSSVENLPTIVKQHTAIVDAIAANDLARAEASLKAHLRRIFAVLDRARAAHPDYFEEPDPGPRDEVAFHD